MRAGDTQDSPFDTDFSAADVNHSCHPQELSLPPARISHMADRSRYHRPQPRHRRGIKVGKLEGLEAAGGDIRCDGEPAVALAPMTSPLMLDTYYCYHWVKTPAVSPVL